MNRVRSAHSLRSVAALALVASMLTALTLVLPGVAKRAPYVKAAASVTQVTHVASVSYSIYGTSDSRSFTLPQGARCCSCTPTRPARTRSARQATAGMR